MSNSQVNHIFECCKKGHTQQLIDALESIDDNHIVDDRQNSVLVTALKYGLWETAQSLIDNNFIYSHPNKPALIAACQCKKDDPKGIQLVLSLNTNIDSNDQQNRTAIMTVSLLGHVKKAKVLIQQNANISLQDLHGNTALMDAVQSNKKRMVQLMLEQKPDVDQTNNQDETALIIELKQKSPTEDIVTQLLEAGSNPELVDSNQKSAWLLAKQKHPKMARLIEIHLNNVNQIELPLFSNDYQSPEESQPIKNHKSITDIDLKVQEAPEERQQNMASDRIEPSIDIEPNIDLEKNSEQSEIKQRPIAIQKKDSLEEPIKPKENKSFLFNKKIKKSNMQEWFHAAKTGNLGGLNRMIIDGIDINSTDDKGCTALIRACGHSRRAVVSFLLQQNANIEARSNNGSTALSSSIIGNCRRVAGLLIDKGADINALGPSDYSYVTIAAAQWNDAMLSILYRNGADIFVLNKSNQTLLHIIALAAEYYNNVNNAKTSIQYLLEHGMDINSTDINGDSALMILCGTHKSNYKVDDRNIASIAHSLIKMGAAAAITNKAGKSALDACKSHKLQQTKGVLMNALAWNDG